MATFRCDAMVLPHFLGQRFRIWSNACMMFFFLSLQFEDRYFSFEFCAISQARQTALQAKMCYVNMWPTRSSLSFLFSSLCFVQRPYILSITILFLNIIIIIVMHCIQFFLVIQRCNNSSNSCNDILILPNIERSSLRASRQRTNDGKSIAEK